MDKERIEQIAKNWADSSVKTWRERLRELPDDAQVCFSPSDGSHMITLNKVELRIHEVSGVVFAILFYQSPEEDEGGAHTAHGPADEEHPPGYVAKGD